MRPRSNLILFTCLAWGALGCRAPAADIVRLQTAAPDVVVVVIDSADGEPAPSTEPSDWAVDGEVPSAVGLWSRPWHEGPPADGAPITMRHHVYLDVDAALVEGEVHVVSTPTGDVDLPFDSRATPCESIKVNQVGYHDGGTIRRAVLGAFFGDLGTRRFDPLPSYDVVRESDGEVVLSGRATWWGDDTGTLGASGEQVHHLDLSDVPAGGPYFVSVRGFGRSHSFGVGPAWSREAARVVTRGLYHQRCGIALEEPYTEHTRGACHLEVMVTDAEPPGFISETGPTRSIRGGHHDAGDYDRRPVHVLVPAWMLTTYEAFPDRFRDSDLDLPESGNGVPDWLDEALWAVLLWEELQEDDGGVRAGTEAPRHPSYGEANAATDGLRYRTYRRDGFVTASAAGLFAQAARLLEPFDAARSDALLERARRAWGWIESESPASARAAPRMYATLQLWLATGEEPFHAAFLANADALDGAGWPEQYNPSWFNLQTATDGMVFAPHFFSYLITERAVDAAVRERFTGLLRAKADEVIASIDGQPYPLGPALPLGWGKGTNQGRYAEPVLLTWRLSGEQRYLDAASRLADYALGLNPLGKSYVTGLGEDPPTNPLQNDSFFTEQRGLGPVPGLVIYGPTREPNSVEWERRVWSRVSPPWLELPEQRRYCEGWALVSVQEFTVWETIALNAWHGLAALASCPDGPESCDHRLFREVVPAGGRPGDVLPLPTDGEPYRRASVPRFRLTGEIGGGERLVYYLALGGGGDLRVARDAMDLLLSR